MLDITVRKHYLSKNTVFVVWWMTVSQKLEKAVFYDRAVLVTLFRDLLLLYTNSFSH